MKKYWMPLAFAITLTAGIFLGWLIGRQNRTTSGSEEKLLSVFDLIQSEYVDEVDLDSLVEMTIPAMLENLDPHSAYIPAKDLTSVNEELDGKFSGIGISFRIHNDTLNVMEVISGGPSEKVGILAGDRIIKVDGEDIAGKGIKDEEVMKMLRGEKGTKVTLTVKRASSKKPLVFDVIRDDIPVESIDASYMLNDSTGYVKVSRFGRTTYREFLQALNGLRLQGAQSFVVDLRNNTGGYMEPAVMMVNEFLPYGKTIVSTKGRDSGQNDILISDGTGAFQDFGLTVILNELSASASEIFSGAVQDNDRGWIVGRRSFGKGLVQKPILLPDSSEIRLTIQRYYTPSGRCIQKDYKPGQITDYDNDLINRFNNGELLSADSIKLNIDDKYYTTGGREVYGGGGIMPDYFVPDDTAHVTSYYVNVNNHGLTIKYSYQYADDNRAELSKAKNVDQLLGMLPPDNVLLGDFVKYASNNGVAARWYYINISAPLIVNQLKALIARSVFGVQGYYEVMNREDKTVQEALRHASMPIDTPKE